MTFQQRYTNFRDFYLVKKGPKNLGIGNPPTVPRYRDIFVKFQLFLTLFVWPWMIYLGHMGCVLRQFGYLSCKIFILWLFDFLEVQDYHKNQPKNQKILAASKEIFWMQNWYFWTQMVPNILFNWTEVKDCTFTVHRASFLASKWVYFYVLLEYVPRSRWISRFDVFQCKI